MSGWHGYSGCPCRRAPAPSRPDPAVGRAARRIAVDFSDASDLANKLEKAVKAASHLERAAHATRDYRQVERGIPHTAELPIDHRGRFIRKHEDVLAEKVAVNQDGRAILDARVLLGEDSGNVHAPDETGALTWTCPGKNG